MRIREYLTGRADPAPALQRRAGDRLAELATKIRASIEKEPRSCPEVARQFPDQGFHTIACATGTLLAGALLRQDSCGRMCLRGSRYAVPRLAPARSRP